MVNIELDLVEDKIDELANVQKFGEIESLMNAVNIEKTNIVVLIAYLRFTKPIKEKLPCRVGFIDKVLEEIKKRADVFYKAVEEFR